MEQRLKVAAYAVCIDGDRILLARYVTPSGDDRYWTLPGGKIEHTEDPCQTVAREVTEESGYQVEVQRLLGVHSRSHEVDWGIPGGALLHTLAIFYRVQVTGGELRAEVGGSTDMAAWVPTVDVAGHGRAVIVDVGLALHRGEPATGHTPAIEVGGLIRQ